MTTQQIRTLCNGIASVAEALNESFTDVMDALKEEGILSEEDAERAIEYMNEI